MRLSIKLLLRDFGLNIVVVDSSSPIAKAWFIETLRNNARHNNEKDSHKNSDDKNRGYPIIPSTRGLILQ